MTREEEPFDSVAEGRSELGRWIVEALSDQGYATHVTTRLMSDGVMQVQIERGRHTRGFTIIGFKELSRRRARECARHVAEHYVAASPDPSPR